MVKNIYKINFFGIILNPTEYITAVFAVLSCYNRYFVDTVRKIMMEAQWRYGVRECSNQVDLDEVPVLTHALLI